jgi:hypothetical protein
MGTDMHTRDADKSWTLKENELLVLKENELLV